MKQVFTFFFVFLSGISSAQPALFNKGSITILGDVTLTVQGDLENEATLSLGDCALVLTGNLQNSGTFNEGTSGIELTGTGSQTLSAVNFFDLKINKPGGDAVLATDAAISGTLQFTQGNLTTAAGKKLTFSAGANVTGENNDNYLKGSAEITKTISGNSPVSMGDLGIAINPANQNITITAARMAGLGQAGVSHGVNPGNSSQVSIDRIWDITVSPDPLPVPVEVTFSWLSNDDNGHFDFTNAQVWKSNDGTNWLTVGTQADATSRSITVSTAEFSLWTVSTDASPLPVALLWFTAKRSGNDALLDWETASETNNAGYSLEVSYDGQLFAPLARVSVPRSHSGEKKQYAYTHHDAGKAAVVYYRLSQQDLNGSTSYLGVRAVEFDLTSLALIVHPNPFSHHFSAIVNSNLRQEATLALTDVTGRDITRQKVLLQPGPNNIPVTVPDGLSAGVYNLTLITNHELLHTRLVKQ